MKVEIKFCRILLKPLTGGLAGLVALGLSITGCRPYQFKAEPNGKVLIPIYSESLKADVLSEIALKDVTDWKSLSGKYVQFFVNPSNEGNELKGSSPSLDFVLRADGTRIARDSAIQFAAIYFHFQELHAMDQSAGAVDLVQWPQKVAMPTSLDSKETNNAFFDEAIDAFIFLPYDGSGLPLTVNGGVLAHEHFHSLFKKAGQSVRARVMDTSQQMQIRAINEGLADYWATLYTKRLNFVGVSLASEVDHRNLDPSRLEYIQSASEFDQSLKVVRRFFSSSENFQKYRMKKVYEKGTELTRALLFVHSKQLSYLPQAGNTAAHLISVLKQWNESSGESTFDDSVLAFLIFYINHTFDLSQEQCLNLLKEKGNYQCKPVGESSMGRFQLSIPTKVASGAAIEIKK